MKECHKIDTTDTSSLVRKTVANAAPAITEKKMNKSLYDGRSRKRWKTLYEDRNAWSRITKQVRASKWGTTYSSASKRGKYAISPINCTGHPTEIRSYLERNKSFNVTGLQCDRENREYLKYLSNVYCVMNNHSKDQDMRTSHKTTN